jgi:hypothetical protein
VSGDSPSGTVTFYDGPNVIGTGKVTNGEATFKTKDLQLGTHPITASYPGDSNNLSSTSAVFNQVVQLIEP